MAIIEVEGLECRHVATHPSGEKKELKQINNNCNAQLSLFLIKRSSYVPYPHSKMPGARVVNTLLMLFSHADDTCIDPSQHAYSLHYAPKLKNFMYIA